MVAITYNLNDKICVNTIDQSKKLILVRKRNARSGAILAALSLLVSACTISPRPLSEQELALYAEDKIARVDQDQEPVVRSISLYEAMARALKYNLDHKVELFAKQLADQKYNVARSDLLPQLVANGAYTARDKDSYTSSRTTQGILSTFPSTSQDTHKWTKDITFSWHVLDFGLSYVRAKQAADRSLIARENKRRVINQIIEDVRTAYWRAVSADRLLNGFQNLEYRVSRALNNSSQLANAGHESPVAALTFERELVDIKRQIQRLQREMRTAKIQLAALMNVRPDQPYKLVIPKRRLSALNLNIPANDMMALALQNRPELRELAYGGRIDQAEAEVALLELLPGIQLYGGANYDTNSFLLDNNWLSWGAKASWNVIRLFQYPVKKRLVDSAIALNYQRALAMTMAIMTQVQVARVRYDYLKKSAHTAAHYLNVQRKIRNKIKASARAEAASEQSLIREEMNTLVASAQYDIAFSDLQNAFANIYSTIGVDPYGHYLDPTASVSELTKALKKTWNERGDMAG